METKDEHQCPIESSTLLKFLEKITTPTYLFFTPGDSNPTKLKCTSCDKNLKGYKVVCMNCNKYHICFSCYQKNPQAHNQAHLLMHVPHKTPDPKLTQSLGVTTDVGASHPDLHLTSCIQCGQHPVIGPMFRCLICHNYRTCESCYRLESYGHDRSHSWIEIRKRQLQDTEYPQLPHVSYDVDHFLANMFLLTFRIWCTPQQLLDKLVMRFQMPTIQNVLDRQKVKQLQEEFLTTQLRTFKLLRRWVIYCWSADFEKNQSLRASLTEAVNKMESELPSSWANTVSWFKEQINILQTPPTIKTKQPKPLSSSLPTSTPPAPSKPLPLKPPSKALPSSPTSILNHSNLPPRTQFVPTPPESTTLLQTAEFEKANKLLLFSAAKDLAEQILYFTSGLFFKAQPIDWATNSPKINHILNFTISLTSWILQAITSASEPNRIGKVSFFIELADRSKDLNDFNTSRCVIEALCHTSVVILNIISQAPPKAQATYQTLLQFFTERSQKEYLSWLYYGTPSGGAPDSRN